MQLSNVLNLKNSALSEGPLSAQNHLIYSDTIMTTESESKNMGASPQRVNDTPQQVLFTKASLAQNSSLLSLTTSPPFTQDAIEDKKDEAASEDMLTTAPPEVSEVPTLTLELSDKKEQETSCSHDEHDIPSPKITPWTFEFLIQRLKRRTMKERMCIVFHDPLHLLDHVRLKEGRRISIVHEMSPMSEVLPTPYEVIHVVKTHSQCRMQAQKEPTSCVVVYTATTAHEGYDSQDGVIYTYDPVSERVRDHAWYLCGPTLPSNITLGITPKSFLDPGCVSFQQAPLRPPVFITAGLTELTLQGKEDTGSDGLLVLDLDLEDIDIISFVIWCFNYRCCKKKVARE
jgi:hypothetical protein